MKASMACTGVTPLRAVDTITIVIAPIAWDVIFSKSCTDENKGLSGCGILEVPSRINRVLCHELSGFDYRLN
jgi:hypothetical protein